MTVPLRCAARTSGRGAGRGAEWRPPSGLAVPTGLPGKLRICTRFCVWCFGPGFGNFRIPNAAAAPVSECCPEAGRGDPVITEPQWEARGPSAETGRPVPPPPAGPGLPGVTSGVPPAQSPSQQPPSRGLGREAEQLEGLEQSPLPSGSDCGWVPGCELRACFVYFFPRFPSLPEL